MNEILPFQKHPGVMIDLETLSTESNAAVVSIGAVRFTYDMGIQSRFKVNISGHDCHKHKLHLCPETIDWWSKQSKDAIAAWKTNPQSLEDGISMFMDWWGDRPNDWFYCNGLSFDAPILRNAIQAVGKKPPWHFRNEMDLRTIYNMIGYDKRKRGLDSDTTLLYHDALADAEYQTKELLELFETIPF
jgi:DNA polymerase III epsilon subunit-like protein